MALKFKYKSKDEIPAELVSLCAEREDTWQLDFDGVADPVSVETLWRVSKAKLYEFRSNNTALLKQVKELKKRFDGIDPHEVRKLAEEKARLEEDR